MPVNSMNVGRDYSLAYYDQNTKTIVDLGDVQNVRIARQAHNISSRPYNGTPRFGYIPDGYTISFTITRTGPQLENFQLAMDAAFNAGGVQKPGFLNETITEPDGSTTRYQYTGFVFSISDLGDLSRDKAVTLSAQGMASDKVALT